MRFECKQTGQRGRLAAEGITTPAPCLPICVLDTPHVVGQYALGEGRWVLQPNLVEADI